MAYSLVTLILDVVDGAGVPVDRGLASLAPSAQLTDTVNNLVVTKAAVGAQFTGGTYPQVKILATDNATLAPAGWAWTASFPGVPGNPVSYSFALPAGPQTFTATNASPAVFTGSGAGYANNTGVQLSGGSLPAGFTAGATYWVVNASGSTFQLAATAGGAALASTSSGSGSAVATQSYLSTLSPVSSAATMAGYLPLPSGTPSAGQVPVATGSGEASAWGNGGVQLAGDLGGTIGSPQVTGTHLGSPLPVAQGGSASALQQPGTAPAYPLLMAPVAWCLANNDFGSQKPLTNYTYNNGASGVGATVTHNVNGVLSADGGSPAVNDRILVLDPYAGGTGSPPHPDGIYTVTSAGSVGTPWVLTRSTDNNTAALLGRFWAVAITNGTLYGGGWAQVCALNDVQGVQSFVVGTSFLGFSVAAESAFASGPWNTASGFSSVALGTQASASGQNSVAVGNTSNATGTGSHGYGPYSTSNGQYAVSLGYESFANGRESVALGPFSVAYSNGQLSEASNFNNVKGDAQGTRAYPCQTTTNATPANLVLAFGTQVKFQNSGQNDDFGKTMLVKYTVVARRTDTPGTDSAWTAQGVLRGNGTNAYTWIGGTPPSFTVVAQDAGASTWAVATSVSSNTLSVTVTGQAAKTIDWTALVETIEAA